MGVITKMWECQHCTAASNKSLWDELEEDLKIKIINHRNESLEIDKLHSEIETYIQMVYKDARELNIRLSLSAVDESYFQEQMKCVQTRRPLHVIKNYKKNSFGKCVQTRKPLHSFDNYEKTLIISITIV